MRQLTSLVLAAMSWSGFASGVLAQPALEKLEKRLEGIRDQPDRDAAVRAPNDDKGYLGVFADDRADDGKGVRIVKVIANGPAALAGLKVGDLITSIDGRNVATMDDFAAAVGQSLAGDKLLFEVARNQERHRLKVTLGHRPPLAQRPVEDFGRIPDDAPQTDRPMALLGVVVDEVTAEVQEALGLKEARGAVVLRVLPGSAAQKAQVPVEAVIVAIDEEAVESPDDLRRLVAQAGPGAEITLSYHDQGEQTERKVRLADAVAGPPPLVTEPAEQEPPPDGASDQERIALLEQRVQELEMRLLAMERLLRAAEPAPRARNGGK
jgi:S1-C subfamily serine protease